MLKFFGDLVEKLAAGALFAGLFQDNEAAFLPGLLFCLIWYMLRIKVTKAERRAD